MGCRPLLLAGFLGIAATGAAKALAHSVSFAVMLAVTTNLLQYSCWKAQGKRCVRLADANECLRRCDRSCVAVSLP